MTLASPFMRSLRLPTHVGRHYTNSAHTSTKCEWQWFADARVVRGRVTAVDSSAGRRGSGREDRQLRERVFDRLDQRGAGFLLAAAAAVGTASAGLQFGKRMHAIGRLAADVMVGHGVAQADIHGAYKNANANDCQQEDG